MKILITLILATLVSTSVVAKESLYKVPTVDEQYVFGPDSHIQAGVPQGEIKAFEMDDSATFPGMARKWWLYIPVQYNGKKSIPVMVFQDGGGWVKREGNWRVPTVLDNLIHKKQLPVMAAIFVNPGDLPLKQGEKPRMRKDGRRMTPKNRAFEYDSMTADYSTFLLTEIFPLARKYVKITDRPEGRGLGGASSGGIASFTAAWQRTDQFRKVFSAYGSYTAIRGGQEYPSLILKNDRKPIKIFMTEGKNDIFNRAGSWVYANMAMADVFERKDYDYQFVMGEGSHKPAHPASILPYALRWLWAGYIED